MTQDYGGAQGEPSVPALGCLVCPQHKSTGDPLRLLTGLELGRVRLDAWIGDIQKGELWVSGYLGYPDPYDLLYI